ncbi:MAG: nicotinate (nicotinamide) nucleotide adenylyltransferase [Chloroflexi bacterium]|nr:nicotinate (nicotinamide) nucleotide adenylyltransferase [Chloroflexota bacterium]
MRIGIFGGTFDPPHLSHLILAAESKHQLSLDRLLFVLTPDPPHKQHRVITPLNHREDMLKVALQGNPDFEISTVEIDRPGPHYAVDTVRLLQEKYPQGELIYLMGGDSLAGLLIDWHKPQEFVDACYALGIMRRPGDHFDLTEIEATLPGVSAKVQFIEAPLLEIASRQIRRRVAEGRPYCYYLHPEVYKIIEQRGLYRTED